MDNADTLNGEYLLRQVVKENEDQRQRVKKLGLLLVGVPILLLLAAGWLLHRSSMGTQPVAWMAIATDLPEPGPSLDSYILNLEGSARTTRDAADYQRLSQALAKRFRASHDPVDQSAASEALLRAAGHEHRKASHNPLTTSLLLLVGMPIVLAALLLVLLANQLVRADERCDEAWAQIEAQLQRRLDLVPAIVEAAKAYAGHERELLTRVTELRAKAIQLLQTPAGIKTEASMANITEVQNALGTALRGLIVQMENYPDIRATTNFLRLQEQLERTENLLSGGRTTLNAAVGQFNRLVRQFPYSLSASLFNLEPRDYFIAAVGAEQAVSINQGASHES